MNLPVVDRWRQVGSNESARYYVAEEGILVVVPHQGIVDTEATARAAVTLQVEYLKSVGRAGAVVVLMDPIQHQEAGARHVYQREIDPAWYTCVALVTSSVLGRALASVFLGLARLTVPTQMFAELDAAVLWARQQNATRRAAPHG